MKNPTTRGQVVLFGDFEVHLRTGDVRKCGHRIRLQQKPYEILCLLLESAGEIVTRKVIGERLWPAAPQEDFDANLNMSLNRLRQALGDTGNEQAFIKTIPRQGYRFIAPVTRVEEGDAAIAPPAGTGAPGTTGRTDGNRAARRASRFLTLFRPSLATLVLATLGAASLLYFYWVKAAAVAERGPRRATLLVTPFQNLSGDASQDYLSEGLTREMITRLGDVAANHLSVMVRNSAMQYKGAHKPADELMREQHADYILEGSVRRQGDQVRITAQLLDAHDHGSLWAETYDRNLSDLFSIQNDVADRIARSLSLEVPGPAGRTPVKAKPVTPEAYDAYLQGIFEAHKNTPRDVQRGQEFFRLSSEKDPQFAPALAALGFSYDEAAMWGFMSPQEAYPKATAAVQRALAIDDTLPDSHLAYGLVLHEYDWDWAGAEAEYRRALELDPKSAAGHQVYAEFLTYAGRYSEALDEVRKGQEADPEFSRTASTVCFVYLQSREFEKAIKQCSEIVELDPQFMPGHALLANAFVYVRRYRDAEVEFQKALELSNNSASLLAGLGMTYALEGKAAEARGILAEMKTRSGQSYVSPVGAADIYLGLGEREQAFAMLQQAMQVRSADLMFLANAPEFDSLHGDPRFTAMVSKIGFPATAVSLPARHSFSKAR